MIPDEAVEAVAAYMHDDEGYSGYFETFEDAPDFRKEHYREQAAKILATAAPHLLAEGWSQGYRAGLASMEFYGATPNPYRS